MKAIKDIILIVLMSTIFMQSIYCNYDEEDDDIYAARKF